MPNQNALVNKKFYYKVYSDSYQYITTWIGDVISEPTFRTVINSGAGELVVTLARAFNNFGEGVDVALGNRVELWVSDNDNLQNNLNPGAMWDSAFWDIDKWDTNNPSFVRIYSGFISSLAPYLDNEEQYVNVTCLGFIADASYKLLRDGSGNTRITYTSTDPSNMLKDVIDKYRADGGTRLNYSSSSISLTGSTATYSFNAVTVKEAMDSILELCPIGWYYFVDSQGIVNLQQANLNAPNHTLTIGVDISYLQTEKRTENIINEITIIGGGNPNLFNIYRRPDSIVLYGKHHRKISDGNVTDNATADLIAKRFLDTFQNPEIRSLLHVLDNNGENTLQGADIESFSIGDTIQPKNLDYGGTVFSMWDVDSWDVAVWDYPQSYQPTPNLLVVSINYTPEYIEIEASSRFPELEKRIEDVNEKVNITFQTGLPAGPTVRTV